MQSYVPLSHGARLIVELRGDVKALGLSQLVTGERTSQLVFVLDELKFKPRKFFQWG